MDAVIHAYMMRKPFYLQNHETGPAAAANCDHNGTFDRMLKINSTALLFMVSFSFCPD